MLKYSPVSPVFSFNKLLTSLKNWPNSGVSSTKSRNKKAMITHSSSAHYTCIFHSGKGKCKTGREALSLQKKQAWILQIQHEAQIGTKFNLKFGLFPTFHLPLHWNEKCSNPCLTQNYMKFIYYFHKKMSAKNTVFVGNAST